MATKSIFKDVKIRDKHLGRGLVSALENAENKKAKEVHMSKICSEVKGSRVKEIFEDFQ